MGYMDLYDSFFSKVPPMLEATAVAILMFNNNLTGFIIYYMILNLFLINNNNFCFLL
jgi:hypothetical protein